MEVQIFGIKKSQDARKAERFFKERKVKIHHVDLEVRPIAKGELARFVQKAGGLLNLIDKGSKTYQKKGLEFMKLSEDRWLELVQDHPDLLILPLVRFGQKVTIGHDEATWKSWME
ncbi:arsenate reductase family protein [Deinococcus misasensis]|uniref:arsenate reductase family protein n=1 Tax=Deinococcus misasensis TaxID=392413 RepID=UPI000B1DBE6B|nr:ArsC/Spx/MgsR family protein [Deinococcus misasensis]